MHRRNFILSSVAGAIAAGASRRVRAAAATVSSSEEAGPLFIADHIPNLTWAEFRASGFAGAAAGAIHRKDSPAECGLPLGSIATGCIDLDTDGTLGYCSIFGSFVPPRGKLRSPLLGLRIAKSTWILATANTAEMEKVLPASDIHYWGHYPVADLEFETSAPVSVGLRAWTPFLPGDLPTSNTPGAIFEIRLRNTSQSQQSGALLFTFPGPSQAEAQVSRASERETVNYNWFSVHVPVDQGAAVAHRQELSGNLQGVRVSSEMGVEYTLAAILPARAIAGAPLSSVGHTWPDEPGKPHENEFGASLNIPFDLGPSQSTVVRVVLAWYAPLWKGEGRHCFTPMYATRFRDSLAAAQFLARNHETLLRRIIAWQQEIYSEHDLPLWLRESLVNNLHLITEVGLWAAAKPDIGDWCQPADGLFAMNESPRECPQMECIPCSFYGNLPVVYFFPELALSTLRGYKAYQYPDGAAPWIFGGCTGTPATDGAEMAMPNRGYQTTTNGISYAEMVDKYWLRTKDEKVLKEFYPSVKRNMVYTVQLNPGPDGVISMPKDNIDPATGQHAMEWVEGEEWFGMTPHIGGLHLAQLKIVERMAQTVGDQAFVDQCRTWFSQGKESLENKLWAGDHYLAYLEPSSGKRSDRIVSCQLDGDWITAFHGLPRIFNGDRARKTLGTIAAKNATIAPWGTVFFSNEDGTPWMESGYGPYTIFVSEQLMLAMTYVYAGQVELGLEEGRRCMFNLMARGYTWDQPCIVEAQTGRRISGYDYYQNMMLWSFPAALSGSDLSGPLGNSGLVERVIKAATVKE